MASLSDKSGKCIEDFFKNQRFVDDSDNIVCSKCGFKTKCFNTITHIQFMHKLLYPTCKTVRYISYKYEDYVRSKKCVANFVNILK